MKVRERSVDEVTVLDVKGQIVHGEDKVHESVKNILDHGVRKIVLNMGEVNYVDSIGLGYIVACAATAKSREAEIKLACLTDRLRSLLVITRLVTLFETYPTVEEAIESFG